MKPQKGSTPSAETTKTIYTLIQQSIDSGRIATTISPATALNWQNLSSIYRSLIGFGQNADQFSILTSKQAVTLDPKNPQQYISLGGIFYQLGQWDQAAQQFQAAVTLKPDFANAYYNLGHALEQKGDLRGALAQYEAVRKLVGTDKGNTDKITAEIAAVQAKISGGAGKTADLKPSGDLEVSTPSAQLPPQNPPVKIDGPSPKVTTIPARRTATPVPTRVPTLPAQ